MSTQNQSCPKYDPWAKKPVENVAICRLCDQSVKYCGGTLNLHVLLHINLHHPSATSKTEVNAKESSFTT